MKYHYDIVNAFDVSTEFVERALEAGSAAEFWWPMHREFVVDGDSVRHARMRLRGMIGHLAWTARHYPGGREFLFFLAERSA